MDDLDNGLGLEDFVKGAAQPGDAPASSQESDKPADQSTEDKTASKDTPTATEKTDTKEDSQKESSPSDTETQVRSTVEEALKGEKKETKQTPEAGKESKEKPDTAGKEEQAKPSNWDSDENPYRQEALRNQQQLQAARSWSNELNKTNLKLQKNMERLEKKIDGTWTEADEKAAADQEKTAVQQETLSSEEMSAMAELRGATAASLHAAYEKDGREKVDAEIREFDSLFQRNALIMNRVTSSKRPIQEAFKVLNEYRTAKKYGTSDMTELIAKVREEAKAELRPQLIEEVTKEIMAKLDLKNKETGGFRNLRGSGRESATEQLSDAAKNEHKPIEELFPG